jgi:hypothetical protein
MRLAKPLFLVLEMLATGGVLVALSGSALADASPDTTTQSTSSSQTTIQQTTHQNDQSQNSATGAIDPTKPNDPTTGAGTNGDGATDLTKQPAPVQTLTAPLPSLGDATIAGAEKQAPTSTTKTAPTAQAKVAPPPPASHDNGNVVLQPVIEAKPIQKPEDPAQAVAPASAPTVTYQTRMMPLQPTITGRVGAEVNDLASSLPTPPKPAKAPVPAKSNGALVKLTAVLAGVVVPQPLLLADAAVAETRAGLIGAGLLILMLAVFVFTYGLWLRRGGFATAARSDAPAPGSSLHLLHHSFGLCNSAAALAT